MAFPNGEQKQIIDQLHGGVLVIAPAGTGKTTVLAARVRAAVDAGIVTPSRALCLTFTVRAAEEMRAALMRSGAAWSKDVTIKTFHGLCAMMLRAEARHIGLPTDFVIYDEEDSKELINEAFGISTRYSDQRQRNERVQYYLNLIETAKLEATIGANALNIEATSTAQALFARMGDAAVVHSAVAYQSALSAQHALDFGDLIYFTRAMLQNDADVREHWQNSYDFLQVDELQDTHLAEYQIVRTLARRSGNLAMIGDLAQTIYGWRGSQPDTVVQQFRDDFSPREIALVYNYRATRNLLRAADSFAQACDGFDGRYTRLQPAPECAVGAKVVLAQRNDAWDEANWIKQRIVALRVAEPESFKYGRVVVLTRTNQRAVVVHDALRSSIPCMTVEQFSFFRRKEVKDALAYLRLLVNPNDMYALRRIPIHGVANATLERIAQSGRSLGMNLTDLTRAQSLRDGEPYRYVLDAYEQGNLVVFDTETTGLDLKRDEVIEIAAVRIKQGGIVDQFHRYISVKKVGDSTRIHGITDAQLAEQGEPAASVMRDFIAFCNGAVLVGHNVGFDLKMLSAHARRLDIALPQYAWLDTCDVARRFIQAPNYRLLTLVELLGLPNLPSHRGDADVLATVDLLRFLIRVMQVHTSGRVAIVAQYRQHFTALAEQLRAWEQASATERPAALLRQIVRETNLITRYPAGERDARADNIERLIRICRDHDDASLHPETALRAFLEYTALSKNNEQMLRDDDAVMICTVHQAKGLEFDHVFIAGAVEGEFPHLKSEDVDRQREEQRLFYVAMTRARKRLFISAHRQSEWGYQRNPSPYMSLLAFDCCEAV